MTTTTARRATFRPVLAKDLRPGRNVREDLGDLTELAASIRANGILQPLVVNDLCGDLVITDGHRRFAAARLAGLPSSSSCPPRLRTWSSARRSPSGRPSTSPSRCAPRRAGRSEPTPAARHGSGPRPSGQPRPDPRPAGPDRMSTFRRAFVRAFVIEGAALTVAIAWLIRREGTR